MKKLLGGLLAAVAMVGLSGCTKESKPGGPGAKSTPPSTVERSYTTTDDKPADKDRTFTVAVPAGEKDLKRGESKDVKISIDRGDAFHQDVTLQFKSPTGITVTPETVTLKDGDKEATVTIQAADDAPLGETNIEVMGMPETGKSVSVMMKAEVHEK
jgi:hypothetical protein